MHGSPYLSTPQGFVVNVVLLEMVLQEKRGDYFKESSSSVIGMMKRGRVSSETCKNEKRICI